jgi:NADH-quinone oxidoreductase subunit I
MSENKKDTKNTTYWKDLKEATQTTAKGLELTWEHFQKSIRSLAKTDSNANSAKNQSFDKDDNSNLGIVTNLYPHEMMPIPDNGRYKLHNEIEDCIVCNKCVEVCPVNCIEIDAIRGTEQVGTASDGSPIRFYAAKFDIDMAKCCFCGLCTVVCPTECLTMTKEFDFSETDITQMNYKFGNLNEKEITEKQKDWDDFQAKKELEKMEKTAKKTIIKPISKPISKPLIKEENKADTAQTDEKKAIQKPIIKIKPILKNETESKEKPKIKLKIKSTSQPAEKSQLRPIKIKLPKIENQTKENSNSDTQKPSKPIIKIKIPKPKIEDKNDKLDIS